MEAWYRCGFKIKVANLAFQGREEVS